ncbi:MAG: hypothetical protein LCH81_16610 [Bacteroidetes bacterium]|nr:hypothetical protein [Bacteroidota bacterium]
MEPPMPTHDQTPLDSFRKEELEIFQSFENQTLVDINYYLWLNQAEQEEEAPLRFLYALELIFESSEALILSSGEDTEAIRVIDAQSLVDTARQLQSLHGKVLIQRISALAQPLWQGATGKTLEAIRLSRNEQGLYQNDAVLFDFGNKQILLQLSEREGLELGRWEEN